MFSVLYSFKVKEGREEDFIQSWKSLTELIYRYEGSFGSKLHKDQNGNFIAYAMWPDRETWKGSGDKLPNEANEFRELMRNNCLKIETEYKLDEVEDLIKESPFRN